MSDYLKLGSLVEVTKEQINPNVHKEIQFKHYSLPNFDDGKTALIESGDDIKSNKFLLSSDHVLVAKLNPRTPRVWATSDIKNDGIQSIASTEFVCLKPVNESDLNFISYSLSSSEVFRVLDSIAIGTTNSHTRFRPEELLRLQIFFPSNPVIREKITQILTSLDKQIEITNRLIEKKKQLKAGLTKDLLTPKGNWTSSTVSMISVLGRGRVISKEEAEENIGIYPVYSSQSLNNGEFARINTYDFDGEYITWTTDGAYAGSVFYRSGKFSCTNVCGTVKLNEGFHHKFFTYQLQTVAKRHVSYVGNPKLMNGVFGDIPIQYPTYAEQKKIAIILDCISSEIEVEENIKAKLNIQKQGLMQDLLTGRVRVN